jgi:thiol:disulfide interchange protein
MVEFYADWCVWCKRMESTTFTHPDVVSLLSSRAVPLRVDGEREGRVLAAKYGVQGYPTTVFLTSDERELGRVPGYLDAVDFVQTTRGWLGARTALAGDATRSRD